MIRKPIPTACDILMNSFLSGSVVVLDLSFSVWRGDRTGAAVHEQSTLLEELSGHTARRLALTPSSCDARLPYSANSLTFSMANDVGLLFVGVFGVVGSDLSS
jgi:hypothetical protein